MSATPTTFTSRELNQDVSGAKRAARRGPVFITDRGRPAHVLLSIEAYRKLTGSDASLVSLIGMEKAALVEFDPPKLKNVSSGAVDLN